MAESSPRNAASLEAWERALKVVVGGAQGHKRLNDWIPYGAPAFARSACGARFRDVDGHEYLDYLLGYGPIVLGHAYPAVNEAVRRQMEEGAVYSIASPLEAEVAEILIDLIPTAEMVSYFVGGSEATTGAVMIARTYTKREKVIRCGYHGWHEWTQTTGPGSVKVYQSLSFSVPYNDLNALEETLNQHRGEVAVVLIESVQGEGPFPGYFEGVRRLAHEHGAVFALDEVKTGFRFALGGAQSHFDIKPDISVLGKAMCNGYPASVVVGRREVMEPSAHLWTAATFHADLLSLAAARATIGELRRRDGIGHQWRMGQRLIEGLNRVFCEAGAGLKMVGFSPMPSPSCQPGEGDLLKRFIAEMIVRGIYATTHPWFLSLSHTASDINHTLNVADEALKAALKGKV